MIHSFRLDGKTYDIDVNEEEGGLRITLDDESCLVDHRWISEKELSLIIEGRSFVAVIDRAGNRRNITVDGEHFSLDMVDGEEEVARGSHETGQAKLSSPMPGNVIRVNVREGDEVKKGASLVIVEAMKMENEIRAPHDALVRKVLVSEGEVVQAGAPLVDLKSLE